MFSYIQSAEDSPLAKKLFHFNYVKRVFIMSNFITITKSEKFSWEEIKLDLRDFIKKYIEEEKEIISKAKKQSSVKSESKSNNIDEKIKNILEEYIKPAVEQDGGAIDFESFDIHNNGTASLNLINLDDPLFSILDFEEPRVIYVVSRIGQNDLIIQGCTFKSIDGSKSQLLYSKIQTES